MSQSTTPATIEQASVHSHGAVPPSSRRVRLVFLALLVPVLLLTGLSLILLWPHDAPDRGQIDLAADTAGTVYGTVTGPIVGNLAPVVLDETGLAVQVMFPPRVRQRGSRRWGHPSNPVDSPGC